MVLVNASGVVGTDQPLHAPPLAKSVPTSSVVGRSTGSCMPVADDPAGETAPSRLRFERDRRCRPHLARRLLRAGERVDVDDDTSSSLSSPESIVERSRIDAGLSRCCVVDLFSPLCSMPAAPPPKYARRHRLLCLCTQLPHSTPADDERDADA